ncbi:Uncharacterised protein [Mycobacteroides abscessus subsp. abscessus]|uniref:Uncharacterized protein n=1 Tax=Mycobacteroides abscessus TaxID=36809 RepID=A0A0U0ZWQ2_9MYCO|nr:Uncharacterised protein [Mycobacteroides abscessus]SHU21776.1 Uncharacterised protein [Mycobacteroides abscessus subsp. abscessus]SHW81889.1 Uncharacterised protein [Mycobacteroides abscessus subsp. abscessus]SIG55892.1 Uncharacterised protein [Mycobacteroides abscessus subsp. abscessus]SKD16095.1 Uncharacterised protein [Mycobacteroides abscessus subsp. abscessus]
MSHSTRRVRECLGSFHRCLKIGVGDTPGSADLTQRVGQIVQLVFVILAARRGDLASVVVDREFALGGVIFNLLKQLLHALELISSGPDLGRSALLGLGVPVEILAMRIQIVMSGLPRDTFPAVSHDRQPLHTALHIPIRACHPVESVGYIAE